MDRSAFTLAAADLGIALSDGQLDAFELYEDKLYEANKVMNLTRIPRAEAWIRHFLDSILFADLIPQGSTVLDIGTGPGLPSWPLACARPDLLVTALDASGKMIAFIQSLPLENLVAVKDRAEDWGVVEEFDVVTGRALAPLAIQLEVSAAPAKVGGMVIPMRTEQDMPEIERLASNPLGLKLEKVERRVLPQLEANRVFPIFRKVGRTSDRYPRSWSDIKRKPI